MSFITGGDVKANGRDPFNWPSLNRKDLMSASGGLGNGSKDLFQMKKQDMVQKKRFESANLQNEDIAGKYRLSFRKLFLIFSLYLQELNHAYGRKW